jgi:peptidoglycan/LPS O-acetylase OafA/YrhL
MRLNRLDILRVIAVFLVLGRHVYVTQLWFRNGWMGVDLFFVLSGFLVSGLLFSEHRKHGQMSVGRFWLRRAFKIYPPFYILLLASIVTGIHQQGDLLAESLFYQNYRLGWWGHTWSLAVEEHFYVLMPLGLMLLVRFGQRKEDAFAKLPAAMAVVAVLVLALRIRGLWHFTPGTDKHLFFHHLCPTHLRIDSLAFGVLIAWIFHYRQEWLARLTRPRLLMLAAASAALIVPCLFVQVEDNFLMSTVGLSALYVGFGGALVVVMKWPSAATPQAGLLDKFFRALGYVGRHSYSIYLWHLPIMEVTRKALPHARDQVVFVIYSTISVAVGIAMAKLIEGPSLRLRDRLLPARRAPEPVAGKAAKSQARSTQ